MASPVATPAGSQPMDLTIAGINFTCLVDSLSRYELPEKECFLSLLAKAIGYAIVVASTILKLPQILLILKNNSIKGLSVPSFEMEVFGYTIAVSYCLFKQLPFSAYGELFFLLIQSIVLVGLLYRMSPRLTSTMWTKVGIYSAMAPVLLRGKLDGKVYEALYTGQSALFIAARIPQIWENFSTKSTGQLSSITTLLNFAGCCARLFTSLQEKAPASLVRSSVFGLILHGTILIQIVSYNWPKKSGAKVQQEEKEALDNSLLKKVD